MKKYEQIDISGDVGLRIWGKTPEELFENAALGMFELITDINNIKETEKKEIFLDRDNYENMIIKWLNELIFHFDTYGFIGRSLSVKLEENTLKAHITGGIFDPDINESGLLLKAATYNSLSVTKTESGWQAIVIFDI